MRHGDSGVADRRGQHDVRRHFSLGTEQLRVHAAHMRILDATLKQAPRLHHLMAGFVDRRSRVIERSHDRKLVRLLGRERQYFREEQPIRLGFDRPEWAANFSGRLRLGIESVVLRRAAD